LSFFVWIVGLYDLVVLSISLLHPLALLFFSFENVRRNELDEFVVEYVEDLAADELQLGLLTWQIIVHDLHDGVS